MYKFYFKKELLETVECKEQANELLGELNIMYKGGVIMKYTQPVEVNTCKNCGEEIDLELNGWFCSKSCYNEYSNDMFKK